MHSSQLQHHEYRKYPPNHVLKIYKAPNQTVFKNGCGNISPGKFPATKLPTGSFQPRKVPPRKFPPRIFPLISLIVFLYLILCSQMQGECKCTFSSMDEKF